MTDKVKVSHKGGPIRGRIQLTGSKSISNRALILNALSPTPQEIKNLSDSDDTQTLQRLLNQKEDNSIYDAHHAGTTFRFMTALLSVNKGEQIMTGSERMQQRPIGPLVEALNEIGANISYQNNEGYPPLKIGKFKTQEKKEISIRSDISSQFLSALCMIAPSLEEGLVINLVGELVSKPYLEMTLEMMRSYGVKTSYEGTSIKIAPQPYKSLPYIVESDWSSASYLFEIAAIGEDVELELEYFMESGLQADATIMSFCNELGVSAEFIGEQVLKLKSIKKYESNINHDFLSHPDLTQTIAVICAAKGIKINYLGLKTLFIKETDRVAALSKELHKVGIKLVKAKDENYEYVQEGRVEIAEPIFNTYEDHRMAMCLAPLGYLSPVIIKNPSVVSKSYPNYWTDLEQLGFVLEWM